MDFDNLHQILAELYSTMIHLCEDMIGVSKGLAGLGALFYVAYRVWQALSRAEPIDVFPLLRPFALGLCIMFFPTIVLGTINAVLSPVVKGTHTILETQTIDLNIYQQQKDMLEYEARVREGKAWLVDNDEFEKRMKSLGITEASEIGRMFGERLSYDIKMWFRDVLRDLFELMFKAAALVIDTLRTFFLLARYISVYLWLPISDIFSSILARIQTLMIESDLKQLADPNFIPDGSSGLYIVFLIIGIIGYFTVPTVAGWIVHSGGTGAFGGAVNKTASRAGGIAGGLAGSMSGNVGGRLLGK